MQQPDPVILAAAEAMKGMPPEEREKAFGQLKTIVALQAPAESLEAPLPVRNLRDYLAVELPNPPSLIDPPVIVPGELTVTVGKSGKGKTTLNLHRMLRWAGGLPMFDRLPDVLVPSDREPLTVMVIENEGAATRFQDKMRTMIGADDYLPEKYRPQVAEHFLVWGDGGYSNFKIDREKDYVLLQRAVAEYEPAILYVEPFRGLWSGNENDNTEVANVLALFQALAAATGVAIVIAHHERKSGPSESGDMMDVSRGGSALDGVVASMENFRVAKGGDYRELSWSKNRYDVGNLAPIRMEYDPLTYWYRYVAEDDMERSILGVLVAAEGVPLTAMEICSEIGEGGCSSGGPGYKQTNKYLNKLKIAGRVGSRPNLNGRGMGWHIVTEDDDSKGLGF